MEAEHLNSLLAIGWDEEKQSGIRKIHTTNNINFILGDNMDFLRWCKDNMMWKYFHIGIVDPPYGIGVGSMRLGSSSKSKEKKFETGDWDNEVPTPEYWELLKYCCRNLIIWGGNYFTKEFDFSGRGFYVWDKKHPGLDFADCELALTDMDFSARIIPKSRSLSKDEGDRRHPTHKPAYLYDYLHLQHELRNKRVLDTHGGSFSHAQAAFRNNVNLTIIDKCESYYNDGIAAFNDKIKNTSLYLL